MWSGIVTDMIMITQKEEGKPGNRKPQKREPTDSRSVLCYGWENR